MKIKVKDVGYFIEGNWKYFKNKLWASPDYIVEQVKYRLYLCKDDCLIANSCIHCTCPPRKKAWVVDSCNNGERFPDLMNKEDWGKFKQENNINIEYDD